MKLKIVLFLFYLTGIFLNSCNNENLIEDSNEKIIKDSISKVEEIELLALTDLTQIIAEDSLLDNDCDNTINEILRFYIKHGKVKKHEDKTWFCDIENDTISIGIVVEKCSIIFRNIKNKTNNARSSATYDGNGKLVLYDSINNNDERIIFYALGFPDSKDRSKLPPYIRRENN